MNHLALAGLVLVLATPAVAQDALTDQYAAARQAFMSDLDNDTLMGGGYFKAVTGDLGGTWIEAAIFDKEEPAKLSEQIAASCARLPMALEAPDLFTLDVTLIARDVAVKTSYVYVGGTSFVGQTDVRAQMMRLGMLERLQESPQTALFALAAGNGPVDIYRPSADAIVITAARSAPRILLRCSATTPLIPGGSTDDELKAALGRAFDSQFPKATDPAKRTVFVDCAVVVFKPLSPEDRQMVIATNFNPPASERERLEAAYPELADGARRCAELAEDEGLPN